MKIKPREATLIYTTPEGTFAEKWGRGIRINEDGTTTDISGNLEFEPVNEDEKALHELFGIDGEPLVIDEAHISADDVLNKPLKKQDIFDIEKICSGLRKGTGRNQRRAIKKAYNKRLKK